MTEDEKYVLQQAHRKIKELRDNKDLFTDLSYSTQFDTEEQKGSFGFMSKPSVNSMKAATADIRHFTMNSSPVMWGKLMKICRQYASEDECQELGNLGKLWSRELGNKGNELGLGIGLNLNGKPLTRKKLIHLWVNGDYMHLNDQASESLALMRGNPFIGIAELVFISAMQNLAILLFNLDERFIKKLLDITD